MSIALYRKYRPGKFSEVEGQNHIKTTLQHELESDNVSHAYMFSGPRGTGKTTVARLLAKAMNCTERKKGESEPCAKCLSCLEIAEGRSMDLVEIDAASQTGVDNVRENIIQNSKYTPTKQKFKVFIIDEVHMLSISAFNALLKTLEEPPRHAIFILATTELHKVPDTIISRCQRFDFRKVNKNELMRRLGYIIKSERKDVDTDVIELIAARSEGCIRDAESLLEQIFSLNDKKITLDQARLVIPYSDFHYIIEFITFLKDSRIREAIDFINRIMYEGVDLERFTDDTIEGLRKILVINLSGKLSEYAFDLQKDQEIKLLELSKLISTQKIVSMIEILLKKKADFSLSPIVQLPLELAAIEICELKTDASPPERKSDSGIPSRAPKNQENMKTADVFAEKKADIDGQARTIIQITFDTVKEKWSDILLRVKQYNHTLFSFLTINKPIHVKDNVIQLGVSYAFHREQINELKNKQALENIIEEILGEKMKVECIIIERKEEPEFVKEDKKIESLARQFGGSVVE